MKRISRALSYVFILVALLAVVYAGVMAFTFPSSFRAFTQVLLQIIGTLALVAIGFLLWTVSNLYDEIDSLEVELERLKTE